MGFENIVQFKYVAPVSPWVKEPELQKLGYLCQQSALQAIPRYAAATMPGSGLSHEEMQAVIAGAIRDIENTQLHSVINL